jgi:hypothetical protein
VRRLYDRQTLAAEQAARQLSRALSPSVVPAEAGGWLDGFLGATGGILLHDDALRAVVDEFLVGLPEDAFIALLPMLRRSFAALDPTERMRLMTLLRQKTASGPAATGADSRAAAAFAGALPLIATMLGIRL